MRGIPKQHWKRSAFVVCAALLGLTHLVYAEGPSEEPRTTTTRPRQGKNIHPSNGRLAWRSTLAGNTLLLSCILDWPGEVRRFVVTCPSTPHIDVKLADCCEAGDHWQVMAKVWDSKPNVALATASGANGDFSMPARVFTYVNNMELKALVECSYLHGINEFPAEADILVETPGAACSAQELGAPLDAVEKSP